MGPIKATSHINNDVARLKQLCVDLRKSGDSEHLRGLARELRLLSGRIVKHNATLKRRLAQRAAAAVEKKKYLAAKLEAHQSEAGHFPFAA